MFSQGKYRILFIQPADASVTVSHCSSDCLSSLELRVMKTEKNFEFIEDVGVEVVGVDTINTFYLETLLSEE